MGALLARHRQRARARPAHAAPRAAAKRSRMSSRWRWKSVPKCATPTARSSPATSTPWPRALDQDAAPDVTSRRRVAGRRRTEIEGTIAPVDDTCTAAASAAAMTLEFHCATDTGRARSNNEDSVAIDETFVAGRAGRRHGRLQRRRSGQRHGHLVHQVRARPLAAARPPAIATDTDVRRAMDICVDNANRAIFNAANSNPQYAGMGTTLVVAVFRDDAAAARPRRRLARLPAARRAPAADHARPLAAAGADRRRPDHRRAGGVLGEQEPGDARGRRRGHGAARDAPARGACRATSTCCAPTACPTCSTTRRIAQLLQGYDSLDGCGAALIDAANDAGGKDNIAVDSGARAGGPARSTAWPSRWWPFRR